MYIVTPASIEEFQQSEEAWGALTAAMPYPTVFCSWEWIYSWWEHFGHEREPCVLFIRRNGQLVGVLPLFSQRQWLRRDGKLGRILGYCGVPELFPDPLDIIASAADAGACIAARLEYLRAHCSDWDVLHLRFVAPESALLRDVAFKAIEPEQVSAAPYIPIAGSYEDYLLTLSSNERSNVRRRRRKMIEAKGVRYTDFVGEDQQDVLRQLFDLHERRAGQKNMHSTFSGPGIRAFHADLLRRLDRRHVWLRGLQQESNVVALFYGFAMGGRISYYQLGYDPEWSESSPGSVLLQETIREAFEGGYSEYNFLQGDEGFKYRWTSHARPLYALDLYNRTYRGRISRILTTAKRGLRPKKRDKAVAIVTNNT